LWNAATPFFELAGVSIPLSIQSLFFFFVLINVVLFFFNLIPLAPLDGFTVLRGLLPRELAFQLERIQPYSFLIFLVLFFFGRGVLSALIFSPALAVTNFLFGL
jgi:Zn-dependent protease